MDIPIGIDASAEPDRIGLSIPSQVGEVVVAIEVVVGIGLFIRILPRKPQIEPEAVARLVRVFLRRGIAEGFRRRQIPPDGVVAGVGDEPRGVEVIRIDVIDAGLGRPHRDAGRR